MTTAAAWVGAYLTVNLVAIAGGHTLAAAPRELQTLVVSGALVIIMVNALMPLIGRGVARLFEAPKHTKS
jgi:hypothetical protein